MDYSRGARMLAERHHSGNTDSGLKASRVEPEFFNMLGDELVNLIDVAELEPDYFDRTQVATAVKALAAGTSGRAYTTLDEARTDRLEPGTPVRVLGYRTLGDGGGFFGIVGQEDDPLLPGGGSIRPIGREVHPEWWGAPGDASGDAGPGFTAAFAYLKSIRGGALRASGRYRLDTTAVVADPTDIVVDAGGARFTTAADILMFDLNGRADPTYRDNESAQFFKWRGGRFICNHPAPVRATAFRSFGFRHFALDDVQLRGFHFGLEAAGKDTLRISGWKSFRCHTDIHFSPWSPIGGPLMVTLEDIHLSHGGSDAPAILFHSGADLSIDRVSVNAGGGSRTTGIEIRRQVCLYIEGIAGAFREGEMVFGAQSGASMKLERVFEFLHPFNIDQSPIRLLGQAAAPIRFEPGETIRGMDSGATARLPKQGSHGRRGHRLVDDRPPVWNIRIGGANHFEAGAGAQGATGVRIVDRVGFGAPVASIQIDAGAVGFNGGGSTGIELSRVVGARIAGRFAQTAKGGVPIRLDSRCKRIHVGAETTFSSGAIDLGGCPRNEVNFDFDREVFGARPVAGFEDMDLVAGTTHVVDFASRLRGYDDLCGIRGGLHPKSARLRVMVVPNAPGPIQLDFLRPSKSRTHSDVSVRGFGHLSDVVEVSPDANGQFQLYVADAPFPSTLSLAVESMSW